MQEARAPGQLNALGSSTDQGHARIPQPTHTRPAASPPQETNDTPTLTIGSVLRLYPKGLLGQFMARPGGSDSGPGRCHLSSRALLSGGLDVLPLPELDRPTALPP